MPTEIERKFLLRDESWRARVDGPPLAFRQFYIGHRERLSLRVRVVDGTSAFLTLKSGEGIARGEFEYAIPLADAAALEAEAVGRVIEKRRHLVPHGRHTIEIDVFDGALAPLVIAEIELAAEDEAVEPAPFLGREVTGDTAYSNLALALGGLPPEAGRF